jgi:hypothetical protein
MISSKEYAIASSTRSCHAYCRSEKGGADADVAVGWGDLGRARKEGLERSTYGI